jgi:hypothetical protein
MNPPSGRARGDENSVPYGREHTGDRYKTLSHARLVGVAVIVFMAALAFQPQTATAQLIIDR